jgi:hypothetical protein
VSKERFRIWIVVEIADGDYTTSLDMEEQCRNFFNEFSLLHLDGVKFEVMSAGVDYGKKTRDLTFAKYFEHTDDAIKLLEKLRKACSRYGNIVSLHAHKPYIEKSYLERKIQDLQYDIIAFNLLNNF